MGRKVVLAFSDVSSLKNFYSTCLWRFPPPIASFLNCLWSSGSAPRSGLHGGVLEVRMTSRTVRSNNRQLRS